jgi:hypothetical protein
MWDQIEAAYARREGTALWWEEGAVEMLKQRCRAEMAEREREARERVRHIRGAGDVRGRASAYLARVDGGESGQGRNPTAWRVVLLVVRGFALEEEEAVALLAAEYAPRCQPRLPTRELRGMVRRALRASKPPWGALLEAPATRRARGVGSV